MESGEHKRSEDKHPVPGVGSKGEPEVSLELGESS